MDYIDHNHTRAELGGMDEDMKLQIHSMEKEAYSFVLRAFIAQSDLLSWGKEGLITELRKELNVTDTEHGELLVKINSDESIKMIREWRKVAHNAQESLYTPGVAPDSVDNVVQKKVKISHSSVLKTQKHVPYGLPHLGSQSRKNVSHVQPFSGTLPSPKPEQFRGDQHSNELAMFSLGNPELSMRTVSRNNQAPSDGKRKGQEKSQPKKSLHAPNIMKRSNVIEIRATDKLIHKVERTIYGTNIPTPFQVEKAKLTLREHEKALLEALDKLADVSDGDDPPHETQHQYYKEHHGNGHGMAAHYNFYRQTGGIHDYLTESFAQRHSVGMRVPFVDVQGEEDIP